MFRIHSHYKENNNGKSLINFYINTNSKIKLYEAYATIHMRHRLALHDSKESETGLKLYDITYITLYAFGYQNFLYQNLVRLLWY